MKTISLTAVLVALLAAPLAAADDPVVKEVESALAALNKAFEAGDAAKVKALMTDDHRSVTPWGGTQDKAEQLKSLPDLKLTEYKSGLMTVVPLGRDAALVTYTQKQAGTFRGKPLPPECYAAAVWVRRDGKWVELHYQETTADAKR